MSLEIKNPESCRYACISLGEIMLRLDPGEGRVHTARQFNAWEGGGEYNVARGLRRCFGLKTAAVTAFADNPIGRLVEDFIMQGGVDTNFIQWKDYDGLGRKVRNGLNFTERGFGIRGARGTPDRGHTAASQMQAGDIDWEQIFGEIGAQWFHTGGIYAALSKSTPEVVIEAIKIAKKHGTLVSYDLNYRPSLWKDFGGIEKCQAVNREIAQYVDVMIGNEEDFSACLGFEIEGVDENLTQIEAESFKRMIAKAVKEFPNFKATATTLRTAKTATLNEWSALVWHDGEFYEPTRKFQGSEILEIYDRVGGGDSFASGLIYGFLEHNDPQQAVSYGCAHGALAMTTPGDPSMASLAEVEKLLIGGSARVDR
ncbi:MAG: 5-dehydro-2-deoxygluconokinase [Opitutia bacterium UBA7350]|nr:MAG: 5-dehydro-2-deoxygluconokinase [Opitutae bacterium UBA7350]